jgi:hypothetical protein
VKYAIRIPSNDSLERDIAELLTISGGIHHDQPGDGQPGGDAVLQAGDSRAVDQGGQAGGEDDSAELPSVPLQRSED